MTNKEVVNRSIGLSFDFLKQLIKTPSVIEEIKDNAVIDFLQKDYAEREEIRNVVPDKFIKVKREFELI
jgi:hypothetical protein